MNGGSKYFAAGIALATLGFLIMAHVEFDSAKWKLQQRRVEVVARALGFAQLQQELREDEAGEDLAQRFAEALPKEVSGVESALIVKKAKLLAHSDPARGNQRLDSKSLADKALYDMGRALEGDIKKNIEERERRKNLARPNPFLEVEPKKKENILREGVLTVAVPAKDGERYRGTAVVKAEPPHFARVFPLKIPALGLAAAVLFFLVGGRLSPRVQMVAGSVALVGVILAQAFAYGQWTQRVRRAEVTAVAQTVEQLTQAGLLGLAADDEERARLAPHLAMRPTGRSEGDILAVETATAAAAHPDAERFDAGRAAVFVSQDYLRAANTGPGLTLWASAFALLAAGVFVLGVLGLVQRAGGSLWDHRGAYAYMGPAMAGMLVLVFVPVIYGISLGFQRRDYNEYSFVGLENFAQILSDFQFSDPQNFYFTAGVTILWTASNVILHVSIGLFFALLLNDTLLKGKGILRVALIVPWAVPNYITALVWKGMFHKQFGAFNLALGEFGIEPVAWFQEFSTAFFTNLSTNTWLGFPFMMVVALGALQSIQMDLYEAAIVDGASRWQRFRNITVPLLMPAMVPAVIVGTVWTFNMFNIIYLVSGGAPNGSTEILITDAFKWAFERDRYGYAAAYSTVIFVILIVFTTITNRITGATKGAFE